MSEFELDPRFEYERVDTFGGDGYYVRIGCHHQNVESVRNVHTGLEVAQLCLDCDEQLPPRREDGRI